MRYNPFRPNSAVVPGMFVGRIQELESIEQSLLQTKNGNPQHFLVNGERGIGKTSLFDYVRDISTGTYGTLDDTVFNFLTVSIDLGGCESEIEIIRKIARGFRSELQKKEDLKQRAKEAWDWITNWEILGIKYEKPSKEDNLDPEEIVDEFVSCVAEFLSASDKSIDGVLFLVDEADWPPVEAGLGKTLKFLNERLARLRCHRVIFGLAGLPQLLSKLHASHESSPRLFHSMLLETLEVEERIKVVNIGLDEANSINSEIMKIDDTAVEFLAELSEGYPHFLQQFAYCAFDADTDYVIDIDDVGRGAFAENGALSQLGDKFFSQMYNARISSEEYRRVLDAMAEYGDRWISRKTIIAESGVSEANVTNALKALRDKEIIIYDDARRGHYRLPTRSFAAWINAVKTAAAKRDVDSEL